MLTSTLRPARALAILALVAASVTGCRGTTRQKPPVHLNWNMDNQASLHAQEPSSFFEDGRGMRLPVANTVAVGELREDVAFEQGHVDGRYLTELPASVELNEALLARGEERYDIYCAPCHGDVGNGLGAVPARAAYAGVTWIVPTFHDEQRRGYPVGRIFDVATNGFSTMSGYRSQISADDRWAISAWVKALQLTQNADPALAQQNGAVEEGGN